MNTHQYVDAVKTQLGIQSDYAVAKALGVSKQAVSRYMKGTGHFDDYVAIRVAKIIQANPLKVVADVNAQRSQDPEMKAVWEELLEKISSGFKVLISTATPHRIRLSV